MNFICPYIQLPNTNWIISDTIAHDFNLPLAPEQIAALSRLDLKLMAPYILGWLVFLIHRVEMAGWLALAGSCPLKL